MKRILFTTLIVFLFSCDRNEEEQLKIYTFSGTVMVPQFDGSDPIPLPDAKLKVQFYTGDVLPLVNLAESVELTADASGNFNLQKSIADNAYSFYSIEVDEPYYHGCSGATSPLENIQYQSFGEEFSYTNNLQVCHTGNVKIVANKTDAGSNTSLTIINKATAGSMNVIDAGDVVSADEEKTYYFFDRVTQVVFTFKKYAGSTLSSEEEVIITPQAGTTVELNVDF
jgi:hypothetical protein